MADVILPVYGTPDNILRVDMKNYTSVANMLLAPPDPSDPVPEEPTPFWGLRYVSLCSLYSLILPSLRLRQTFSL